REFSTRLAIIVPSGGALSNAGAKLEDTLRDLVRTGDKDATIEVQILLSNVSAATLERLRGAGLEILTPPGKELQVSGRIAVGKLADLATLDAVRYVVKRRLKADR